MTEPVLLTRQGADVPWGFRLHGGADQQSPLTVQRVTPGSVASMGLVVGDEILRIGNTDASRLTYAVAMETIKNCGDRLELYTSRTGMPEATQSFSNYSHLPHALNNVGETRLDSFNHSPSRLHDGLPQSNMGRPEREISREQVPSPVQPQIPAAVLNVAARTAHPRDGHPHSNVGRPERQISKEQVSTPVQPQMPDAVLNVAARTAHDKRPWTYAPDYMSLQQQRRRVQRQNLAPTKVDSPQTPIKQYASLQPYQPHQTTSHPQDGEVERNGEGVYENIYSGADVPSKTFKRLQSFTSSPDQSPTTGLARAAQRRQRRRENLQTYDKPPDKSVSYEPAKSQESEFNEAAYLAGRIPIIGTGSTKRVPLPSYANARKDNEPEEEREDENKKPFDERAYLAGRIPLVSGGPINPALFNLPTPVAMPTAAAEEDVEENKKPFDERAYLAGRIPLVQGGAIDPTQFNVPERRVVKKYKDVNRPLLRQPFDERAYLAGKLNILGETNDRPPRDTAASSSRAETVKPSWCKSDEDMVSEDEYDEDSFLKGRIAIVRRSVDRELPHRRALDVIGRPRISRERAAWERGEVEDDGRGGIVSDTEFDERAYLAGRRRGQHLATDKEYSTDTETEIPSKTLRFLRRSVSSERSGDEDWRSPSSAANEDETGGSSDQEKPYDCYMYHGRKIPSKIFSRLQKTMDRKAAAERKARPADPIERLKEKSLEHVGIDVDTAIERLEIGKHDPDTYMKILKQSVEQNNIRIEPDNEVTDF